MKLSAKVRAFVAVSLVLGVVLIGFAYFLATRGTSDGRPVVVGSFYPYYFAARSVGGDRMRAVNLVPPGVEPHDWEPSPDDMRTIYTASVFVFNGYLEGYLPRILADLPADGPLLVNASAGLAVRRAENGQVDPHVWLDPTLMSEIVDKVEAALRQRDPAGNDTYRANALALKASLASLDDAFVAGLRSCALRTIVVAHESFGYLATRYNLTMVAIEGLSPDAEPTPQKLQEILAIVNETGVQFIFYEELVSPQVAQTLAEEAGIQTMLLDPLEGLGVDRAAGGETYLSIMEGTNLSNLRTALGCT
ncbi:MAG TPA: zinc ABC transporter substrate-binding protein [Thermoplasmata archaeon]|nr:zinc ABC transporter substrate-binding protein [Thermoplasmata archaeon]